MLSGDEIRKQSYKPQDFSIKSRIQTSDYLRVTNMTGSVNIKPYYDTSLKTTIHFFRILEIVADEFQQ